MLMALGEGLSTTHPVLVAVLMVLIIVHEPSTSLEELSTHTQDLMEISSKR